MNLICKGGSHMTSDTKKMQIYDLLKERIENGFYAAGSRLPKEIDLADELKIARITLRSALELLEMERLVFRIKGRGTFVRDCPADRIRIMLLLSEMEYRPEKISNPFLYILPCLQSAADRMNVRLIPCDINLLLTSKSTWCAEKILRDGIQGIIWLGNNFTGKEPLLKIMRETGLPILLPHASVSDVETTGFTVMATNYEELTKDGLKYLAAQGHRRVAYIGRPNMRGIDPECYLEWVEAAGLDPDPDLLRQVNWRNGKQTVFDALKGLMNLSEPPTAIFCYSDYLSLWTYEYLHRANIRIPDDVGVLTTGGQIGCDFLDPPLSALEYGNEEIGKAAVELMLEMVHDRRRMKFVVTPHRLVTRESTRRVLLHHEKLKKEKRK
ncbi:MAG: GntR family transcriptional regulator [Lentisphaeria bacterium]|nr:GntR family transcriptional regulator [Lentisphaeria bacterium]